MTSNKSVQFGLIVALVLVLLFGYFKLHKDDAVAAQRKTPRAQIDHVHGGSVGSVKPAVIDGARPTWAADGMVAIPLRFQLPGVSYALSAPSYKEWLAQYPGYKQERIRAFNEKHLGVYRVNSREQVAWMARNGYPMPEDVLAAEGMSDAALQELAEQGNDKAVFLLIERHDAELAAYLAKGGTRNDYFSGPGGDQRSQVNIKLRQLLEESNSPYKGYVQAAEAIGRADMAQRDIDAQVIAGLSWAQSLGDMRASQFIREYVGSDPDRLLIWNTAALVGTNASISMRFMEESGGQRAGTPRGMGVPGNFSPVH